MIFHITYTIAPETRDEAQARFKETGALPADGVTMVGRWHCAEGLSGFIIAESSDSIAIARWIQEWTDLLSFEITPVLTDEQIMQVLA